MVLKPSVSWTFYRGAIYVGDGVLCFSIGSFSVGSILEDACLDAGFDYASVSGSVS